MEKSFLQQLSASGRYDSEELVIRNSAQLIADLRSYLKANNMDMALSCLDLTVEKKRGEFRKDKKTPAILHEVSQALYTISLIEDGVHLDDPESVIALNCIHDLGEDFGVKPKELANHLQKTPNIPNHKINQLVFDFDIMTKKYKGEPAKFSNEYEYYVSMQNSANASLAKLIDRIHNVATQIGVRSEQNCADYITGTEVILNDFVNNVSTTFRSQENAYQNTKNMLQTLCQINRYYLARNTIGKPLPNSYELLKEMPDKGFNVPLGLNPISLNGNRIIKEPGWNPVKVIASNEGISGVLRNLMQNLTL